MCRGRRQPAAQVRGQETVQPPGGQNDKGGRRRPERYSSLGDDGLDG